MPASPPFHLSVRSYGRDSTTDTHGFAQIVLPLEGGLSMEIGARGGEIARGQLAFVDRDMRHDQVSALPNRSFILDLDPGEIAPRLRDRLNARPYAPLPLAASRLVDFMALTAADKAADGATLGHWVPLLLDSLAGEVPRAQSRLGVLLAAMEARPGAPWTAAAMADRAGLSVSRLHALFREELATTPRAWLSELRLDRVRAELTSGALSIAELAYRYGYSDQSALTRALRKATGLTPAAYRKQAQESGTRLR